MELARLTDTPTPHIDTVFALTKLLAKTLDESKVPGGRSTAA
jgi:2-dehydropantoate 2-reductase